MATFADISSTGEVLISFNSTMKPLFDSLRNLEDLNEELSNSQNYSRINNGIAVRVLDADEAEE